MRSSSGHRLRRAPLHVLLAVATFLSVAVLALSRAAETLPPAPRDHFNDYARLVRPATATQLNQELAQFERDTSNQLLVAIFPRLPSASSVEDTTVRLAQSWRVGQKARDNGAILFVFQESRDLRIQVGYGLEGALPDALCKRIIEEEIVPRFRAGDFDAGLTAGVRSLMAAARGEYRGSGKLATDASRESAGSGVMIIIFAALMLLSSLRAASRRQTIYGRRGRRTTWINWGGGGGGGGWGGGSSSGGGSFSGGGGSFGGGGAGGKW